MATKRFNLYSARSWDILGCVFGFIATATDFKQIILDTHLSRFVPNWIIVVLLNLHPYKDSWIIVLYLILIALLGSALFLSEVKDLEPQETDPKTKISDEYGAVLRKIRIKRYIFSLGLVFLREQILDKVFKVTFYGTFSRARSQWKSNQYNFDSVDRILFHDGSGIEIQYPRHLRALIERSHPGNDDNFSQPTFKKPSLKLLFLLLFASNAFPLWLFASIVTLRIFKKVPTSIQPTT